MVKELTTEQKEQIISDIDQRLEDIRRQRIEEEKIASNFKEEQDKILENISIAKAELLQTQNLKALTEKSIIDAKYNMLLEVNDSKKQIIEEIALVKDDLNKIEKEKDLINIELEGLTIKKEQLINDNIQETDKFNNLQDNNNKILITMSEKKAKIGESVNTIDVNASKIDEQTQALADLNGKLDELKGKIEEVDNVLSIKIKNVKTLGDKEDYLRDKETYLKSYLNKFGLEYEPFVQN